MLENFENGLNVAVFGSHGGIGEAFVNHLAKEDKVSKIYSFSRSETSFNDDKIIESHIDIEDENSIEGASEKINPEDRLDIIIIATGLLHNEEMQPEKSLRDLNKDNFLRSYAVNAIGPALIAKHFIPLLNKDRKSVFTAISARVSSISDNYLGGWYSYRASKTALNQIIKTISIEVARRNKQACIFGLHPGTVDTKLSEPFKTNVAEGKLFTPEFSAESLLKVVDERTTKDNGKLFAWNGEEVPY